MNRSTRSVRLRIIALLGVCYGLSPLAARTTDAEEGFKPIFDGKTLNGWDGNPKFWRVEDGAITGQTTKDNPTKGNTFIIWRQGKLEDFELRLEYRVFGGNSGIQYRSWEEPEKWGKWVVGGYQADLGDPFGWWGGALYEERQRGFLGLRGNKSVVGENHKPKIVAKFADSKKLESYVKNEDWNEYHIIAKGNHFIHKINGHLMVDITDEDASMRRSGGILAFQVHQGPPMKVQFRNIRLKRL